jgi:hypothetical protein
MVLLILYKTFCATDSHNPDAGKNVKDILESIYTLFSIPIGKLGIPADSKEPYRLELTRIWSAYKFIEPVVIEIFGACMARFCVFVRVVCEIVCVAVTILQKLPPPP